MGKLLNLFDRYDNIIFDMDGVITAESEYWTAAALTVYEWINSRDYFGEYELSAKEIYENRANIRQEVFINDKLIGVLKNKGVNSNWDLAYVTFALSVINKTKDYDRILKFATELSDNILDEYENIGMELGKYTGIPSMRNDELWLNMMFTFQEWYLGESLFRESYYREPVLKGKNGLISEEKPIVDKSALLDVLSKLKTEKKRLSIATGRPGNELIKPLKNFGVYDFFEKDAIITYDYVKNAEEENKRNLSKPHPYTFIKSMLGKDYPDKKIIENDFEKSILKRTLVVGDAGADLFAAKAMGVDFLAVLTGVMGEKGRKYFEENGAEYILSSVADFVE